MNKWLPVIALGLGLLGCGDEPQAPESDTRDPQASMSPELTTVDPAETLRFQKISNVGATCSVDSDCRGTAPRCITAVPIINSPLEVGHCTASCTRDNECGSGGGCPLAQIANLARLFVPDAGALSGSLSICLPKCRSNADCPSDLPCQDIGIPDIPLLLSAPNSKYCLPPQPQRVDGGLLLPDGGFLPINPDAGFRLPDGGTIPGLTGIPGFPGLAGN